MSSEDALKTEKALNALEAIAPPDLTAIGPDQDAMLLKDAMDVTAEFIAPAPEPVKDSPSQIWMYKGTLKRLETLYPTMVDPPKIGVFAGKNHRILDVLTGASVDEVAGNQEMKERWDKLGYTILGIVCWGAVKQPQEYEMSFEDLLVYLGDSVEEQDLLLHLVCVPGSSDPCAWDITCYESKFQYQSVSLCHSASGREKSDTFLVQEASRISVSIADQARTVLLNCFTKNTVPKQQPILCFSLLFLIAGNCR